MFITNKFPNSSVSFCVLTRTFWYFEIITRLSNIRLIKFHMGTQELLKLAVFVMWMPIIFV